MISKGLFPMRHDVTTVEKTKAIQEAVRESLLEGALLGHSACIWEDGKVVWLSPEEVLTRLGEKHRVQFPKDDRASHD